MRESSAQNSSTARHPDCLSCAGLTSEGFLEKCRLRIEPQGTPAVILRALRSRVNRWHARPPLAGIAWRSWRLGLHLPSVVAHRRGCPGSRPLTALMPARPQSLSASLPAVTRSPQGAPGRPSRGHEWGRGDSRRRRRTWAWEGRGVFRVVLLLRGA